MPVKLSAKKEKRYAIQTSPPPLPPIKKLKGQGKAKGEGSSESEDPPQDLGTSGPEGTCCQLRGSSFFQYKEGRLQDPASI